MEIITKKVSDLIPYINNPRKNDNAVDKVASSIKNFGFKNPIIIDTKNEIVAGHTRLKAAKKLGLDEVPCIMADDLTDAQIKAFRIADNKVGEIAEWDYDILNSEIEGLPEFNFEDFGFSSEELGSILENAEAKEDDFEVPEEDEIETDIVIGDLFEIGPHRLLCGDSTDKIQVERLMNGEKADMVFTDPPYGISCSGKGITANGVEANDFGTILNDKDVNTAINNFRLICEMYPNSSLIYWGANYYPQCLPNGYGWLFWDKETQGSIFSGGEIAFVNKGVRFDVFRHRWAGFCKDSERGEKRVHPTQKPIELIKFCFETYDAGNLILDCFLGSGSTMVAAHQLKRKCYGIELDPKYCQVIIDRMKALDPNLIIKKNGEVI